MSLEFVLGHLLTSGLRRLGRGVRRTLSPRSLRRSSVVPFPQRFHYLRLLGEGGQGVVHLCSDRRAPGVRVAVKVARPRPEALIALEREARVLRALHGSYHVPELRALLFRNGQLCGLATRYLVGETLDSFIISRHMNDHGLARKDQLSLTISIVDAVLDVLRRGFLHRDLKPENLFLARDGQVRIFDFGLALRISDRPQQGELSGTLAYASPEQVEARPLDARSDLFSLGVTLYELTTGQMFFPSDSKTFHAFMVRRAQRLRENPILDGVEPEIHSLIRRLIVADRTRRADIPEVEDRLSELRRALN